MEPMQSAYRAGHSTETALIKVKPDVLNAIDNKEVVCLVLLDLSAAFDTVDHQILLERLKNMFGLTGTVINWITSYLSGGLQKVVVGDANSSAVPLSCGIPQGSIFGPILFMLYTTPLGKICNKHAVTYHLYADDQQLYLAFKPSNAGAKEQCIEQLQGCITDICKWMSANMLKLNDEKNEFIMFGTNHQLKKMGVNLNQIAIGNTNVLSVDHVCNLEFLMDNTLKNQSHINKLTSSSFNQLMNIRRIHLKLDQDTTKYIIQALVISKLDYCNFLLLGSADYQLNKMQWIQNMACRIVCNLHKFNHVASSMQDLHWLKITYWIQFKIACIMFKCINGQAPKYLTDTSDRYTSILHRSSLACNASFPAAGPRLWNSLPKTWQQPSLDMFRWNLKTHLFKICYYN